MAKNPQEEINNIEGNSLDTNRQLLGYKKEITDQLQKQSKLLDELNIAEAIQLQRAKTKEELTDKERKTIVKTYMSHKDYIKNLQQQVEIQKKSLSTWQSIWTGSYKFNATFNDFYKTLMEADKAMKEVALEFGTTGTRSENIRAAIEGAAIQAARLGMSTKELSKMYSGYVDEVGRTVSLSDKQLESMSALAKGTGLGVDQASKLAGQFELMGKDAISVNKTVEGILETSERMGVNATKVLKTVSANFKKLQTYTFRKGTEGMGELAAYAEKFKVDMTSTFSAAEKARTFEGALEMGAKLQVLGGQFSKLGDFGAMLYESRNDLTAFNRRIAEMTRGMVTLNKTAKGFEYQMASPMARDMLEQAGKALGIDVEKMSEMAFQQKKINDMRSQMLNSGYTKEQMDIITGLAQMDNSTGKFFVTVKNVRRDIANLTSGELKTLKDEKASLAERAKNAQTFDEQFKIFMNELKATALPMLEGINKVLQFIRAGMDDMTKLFKNVSQQTKDTMKGIGAGIAALLLIRPLLSPLLGIVRGVGGLGGRGLKSLLGKKGLTTATEEMGGGAMGGRGGFGRAIGKGAGMGLAMAGAGAGIMLAAKGIAMIAESMKGLSDKQVDNLKWITVALGPGMALSLGIMGKLASGAAQGIGILTLAMVGMGAGILMAGKGIKFMSEGLSQLIPIAAANKSALLGIAGGILAIEGALTLGGASSVLTVIGAGALYLGLKAISANADGISKVGEAFKQINVALSGSKDNYKEIRDTVEAIANADLSNLKNLSNLNSLFSQPLKVEFADKELTVLNNITLEIDGEKFIQKLNIPYRTFIEGNKMQQGVSNPSTLVH